MTFFPDDSEGKFRWSRCGGWSLLFSWVCLFSGPDRSAVPVQAGIPRYPGTPTPLVSLLFPVVRRVYVELHYTPVLRVDPKGIFIITEDALRNLPADPIAWWLWTRSASPSGTRRSSGGIQKRGWWP